MDIENLNKSQIVLLTLLISFMTSIATGIVTVSLMEQAPPVITETVNRVVEHTVERVVTGQVASASEPVTKTVVVKESDLIPQAVENASPSVVRLYSGEATSSVFLGLGVVFDGSGTIVADSEALGEVQHLQIELSGGMRVPAYALSKDESVGVSYLAGATSTTQGPVQWRAAQFMTGKTSLGQTVIAISGKSATRVSQGLVTTLSPLAGQEEGVIQIIETDIPKDVIISGSPIIDTSGSVLGISTMLSRGHDGSGFITVASLLSPPTEKKPETQ